ncbi:MAG: InlB B-repeat-containing protein, partial [Eubacterium sp.]
DGWVDEDGNYFDENTVVEGEKKIKPSWKPKEYTVTYVSGDFGSIGGETTPETVVYGQKPTHKITTKPMIKCDFVGFEYVDKNGHTKSTLDTQKVVIECDTTFKAVFIKWPFLMASSNHAKVGIGFGDALPNITDNTVVEHVPPEDDGTGGSCIAYWKPDAGHRLSSIEVSLAKIEGSKMALDLGTTNPQSFLVGDKTVTMVVDLENERVLFDKLDESVYVNFMFEAEQKTVTFVDKDGNTVGTPQKVDYGSDARVEKAPEYEGLIFTGWYSAQEGGDKVENFKKITEDLTVYAQYKVREHTVTFKDKDSQTIGVPQVIVHDGNAVEEAAPVIEGFAFKGWYTAPDGGKKVISFTNIKEDVTVYAQYEKLPDEVSYTVTGTKYGYGSITEGTGKFKDGASTTVKWKADPGYKVTQVIIDGKVRDDLLKAGQFEFKDIHENHEVYVAFSKAEENEKPNEEYYTVYTTKKGDEEGCDLTETSTVKAGENHTVVWRVKEGYQIKHITVDGVAYAISDVGNIPFNGISSDHTVIVEYERIKTEEPEPDPDINLYKVITRQTGGVYTSISPSAVVTEGSNYTVEWEPARMENKGGQIQRAQIEAPEPESYIIDSVTIDKGLVTERPLSEDEIETKAYPFEGIDRDYTVDIVFKKAVGEEEDAQKEKLLVNTELVGGPGVITPSAVVNQGDDFPVLWTAGEGYVVDTITVKANGVEMPGLVTSQDLVDLKNINDHYDVIVKLKKAPPAGEENPEETLYAITTSITGAAGACITPTLENIREGESHFVTWSVPEGYEVSSVIIDKVVIDGLLGATRVDFNEIVASHDVLVVLKLKNTGEDKEEYFEIKTSIESGGTITPTTRVEKGANHTVSWTADEGYIVARVEVNGVLRNDLIEAGKIDFTDIAKNHEVNVIFEKKGDIDPPPEDVLSVTTKITGGKGNITGGAIVKQGDDYRVEWTVEEGYEILDVIINGESRPDLLNKGQINLENINKNQQVEVVLGKAGPGTDPTPDPGPGTDPTPDPGPGTDPDPDPGDGSTGDINNGNSDNNTQNDQSPAEKLESEVKKSITAVMSEISPYTGIKDTLDHGAGQNQGAQRSRGSLMSLLFGNPDGVPGEGFFTKGNGNENEAGRMSLSLVDFFATALITALSVLALFRKRRSKIVMIVLAAVSIVLFFLTQPMVWVFTLWDRFSILFILLLLLGAVIMLASNKKERETEEESQENRA